MQQLAELVFIRLVPAHVHASGVFVGKMITRDWFNLRQIYLVGASAHLRHRVTLGNNNFSLLLLLLSLLLLVGPVMVGTSL